MILFRSAFVLILIAAISVSAQAQTTMTDTEVWQKIQEQHDRQVRDVISDDLCGLTFQISKNKTLTLCKFATAYFEQPQIGPTDVRLVVRDSNSAVIGGLFRKLFGNDRRVISTTVTYNGYQALPTCYLEVQPAGLKFIRLETADGSELVADNVLSESLINTYCFGAVRDNAIHRWRQAHNVKYPPPPPPPHQLTATDFTYLINRIRVCWNLPANDPRTRGIAVDIKVKLSPDGYVREAHIVDEARMNTDSSYKWVAISALRAVKNPGCQPWELPREKYDLWGEITLHFSPE